MKKTLPTVAALVAGIGFIGLAVAADVAQDVHKAEKAVQGAAQNAVQGSGSPTAGVPAMAGQIPPAVADCMKQAETKKLAGDAAKSFMDGCLKAAGVQPPPVAPTSGGAHPPAPKK